MYRARAKSPCRAARSASADVDQHREGVGDALRFRLTPWLYVKASYEYADALASPDELFGDGVLVHANLELEPEISHNANLGPRLELKRTPVGDFVAEVNGFLRDADHLVVLLGNDRFMTYQNVYGARSLGVENALSWSAPRRRLSLEGGLTCSIRATLRRRARSATSKATVSPIARTSPRVGAGRLRFPGFPGADDTLEPFYNGRYVHEFFRGWESQGLREFKQVVDSQMVHASASLGRSAKATGAPRPRSRSTT